MAIGIFQRGLDVFVLYDEKRFEKGPLTYEKFPGEPTPESLNAAINYVDEVLLRFAPSTQTRIVITGPPLPPTGSGIVYISGTQITASIQIKGTNQNVLSLDPYRLCEAITTRNLHIWTPIFLTQLKQAGIGFNLKLESEDFSNLPAFRMF